MTLFIRQNQISAQMCRFQKMYARRSCMQSKIHPQLQAAHFSSVYRSEDANRITNEDPCNFSHKIQRIRQKEEKLLHSAFQHQKRNYAATTKLEKKCKQNLSVAIVGTGPSGCYTAKYLLSTLQQLKMKQNEKKKNDDANEKSDNQSNGDLDSKTGQGVRKRHRIGVDVSDLQSIDIDMIEKLPTPFGLVRSGVAPDHPEVKNVENDFSKLFNDYSTTSSTRTNADSDGKNEVDNGDGDDSGNIQCSMELRGNVTVGKDVSLPELQQLYDIVVLAYGCESDRKLGLEGEDDLKGIFSAREFVAWYNGHPDFAHLGSQFEDILQHQGSGSESDKHVVVIGQGNVALDCARVLAKGQKGLMDTDITSDALRVIGDGVKCTSVVGRRGHVQGSFTIKELRELTKLDDASLVIDEEELDAGLTDASRAELDGPGSRPKVRMDKLLRDAASNASTEETKHSKQVKIRFLLNPVKFVPRNDDSSRLGSVICERTLLEGWKGEQKAVGTGFMEEIPADMALVSIGYKGLQIPGLDDSLFDQRQGTVINSHGKVVENVYVCGWLKRGPTGIIGTNLVDAKDTISSILTDLEDLPEDDMGGRQGLDDILAQRDISFVDWSSYLNIDAAERDQSRLRSKYQPREKFTHVNEMLLVTKE